MRSPRWLLPLAIAAAALFIWRLPALWPLAPLDVAISADSLTSLARKGLAAEGVDTREHWAAVSVGVNGLALDHTDSLLGRRATLAWAGRVPLVGHDVVFKKRGDPNAVWATVHRSGHVVRWARDRQDDDSGGVVDSATAHRLTFTALQRAELDPSLPPWAVKGIAVRERPLRTDRTFTVERVLVAKPELKERAVVVVSGSVVTQVSRGLVVPDDARRARRAGEAPMVTLGAIGYLLLAAAIVGAFVLLLHGLRDGTVRIAGPGVVAAVVFTGVIATFFLEPDWLMREWDPLWPLITAPLLGLQQLGLLNAWLALVLFTVIAAGDAEDRRVGTGRGDSLWRLLRGEIRHPSVAAASWHGFLIGFICGGVMAGSALLLQWGAGAQVVLQPRGFFVKVLDAWSPMLTSLLFFTSVALAEELGYRFFIGTWLDRLTGKRWMAIALPALVYGLTHTPLDFLPPNGPFWARPLVLTLIGATWGWAFFRFDALTVVLSHLTADLFIFNWPRLASGDTTTVITVLLTIAVPLLPAVVGRLAPLQSDRVSHFG